MGDYSRRDALINSYVALTWVWYDQWSLKNSNMRLLSLRGSLFDFTKKGDIEAFTYAAELTSTLLSLRLLKGWRNKK